MGSIRVGGTCAIAAVMFGLSSGPALSEGPTYVVSGSGEVSASWDNVQHSSSPDQQVEYRSFGNTVGQQTRIVQRRVAEPAATVSRELRQQPTFPDLVEVQRGGVQTLIDPQKDYQFSSPPGVLHNNHPILQAQRLTHRPMASSYVIHGSRRQADASDRGDVPEPAAVLPAPQQFRRDDPAPKRIGPHRHEPEPRRVPAKRLWQKMVNADR